MPKTNTSMARTCKVTPLPLPEKNGGRIGKRTCKFEEQEENPKRAYAGRGQEAKWKIADQVRNINQIFIKCQLVALAVAMMVFVVPTPAQNITGGTGSTHHAPN